MRRLPVAYVILSLLCLNTNAPSLQKEGLLLYVSTEGNDEWSGILSQPNIEKTDGPFATLTKARNTVREMKKAHMDSPITILIRGGRYILEHTVVFGLEDSGSWNQTITYAVYPGEEPVFTSGIAIKNWEKLTTYPPELPEPSRKHVWVSDISVIGKEKRRFYTLYDSDGRLPRARGKGFAPEKDYNFNESVPGHKGFRFPQRDTLYFPKGALKEWPNLEDIEIVIRPLVQFSINILPLKKVDVETGIAYTSIKGTYPLGRLHTGYEEDINNACWVENVIDVLDEPGEWVLNTKEGNLYLWPVKDNPEAVYVPQLTELIRVEGEIDKDGLTDIPVTNIVFRGLTFTQGDRAPWTDNDVGLQHDWEMEDKANSLVRFRGVADCTIDGCRFSNSGGGGIRLDLYCIRNTVRNCLFESLGGTGILLCGYGPGMKNVNRDNTIFNNHIHHCAEISWHNPAIFIWQSAHNWISNNLIHSMPYNGMVLSSVRPQFFDIPSQDNSGTTEEFIEGWREAARTIRWDEVGNARVWPDDLRPYIHTRGNMIEKNEIHNVMLKLGDGNAIYLGMGEYNTIRHNYIHHVDRGSAIRTDGIAINTNFTGNIIYKCNGGFRIKRYNNHIENNILINIAQTPLALKTLMPDLGTTRIQRNIFYSTNIDEKFYTCSKTRNKGATLADKMFYGGCDVDYNMYFIVDDPQKSVAFLEKMQEDGVDKHSLAVDPLFEDVKNENFRLKPESPAFQLGFSVIDPDVIGITPDFPERFIQKE